MAVEALTLLAKEYRSGAWTRYLHLPRNKCITYQNAAKTVVIETMVATSTWLWLVDAPDLEAGVGEEEESLVAFDLVGVGVLIV